MPGCPLIPRPLVLEQKTRQETQASHAGTHHTDKEPTMRVEVDAGKPKRGASAEETKYNPSSPPLDVTGGRNKSK